MFGFGREKYSGGDILCARVGIVNRYGVYVGKGQVVHFSAAHGELVHPDTAKVRKTSLSRFSAGEMISVSNSTERLPSDRIIQNALSMLSSGFGFYDQISNNSEHFARWCETGIKPSSSSNDLRNGLAMMAKGFSDIFGRQ